MNASLALRLLFVLSMPVMLPLLSACESAEDGALAENLDQTQTPPQAPFESAPRLDYPQTEIWIPGFWGISDHQFVWVSGKIIARPSPTAVWSPARWVKHAYGWSFQQGHWE